MVQLDPGEGFLESKKRPRRLASDRFFVRLAVESELFAFLHIRVIAFRVTPYRFLAINHRPTQTTGLVVHIKRCQIVGMTATEIGVLFEQTFLNIEADDS